MLFRRIECVDEAAKRVGTKWFTLDRQMWIFSSLAIDCTKNKHTKRDDRWHGTSITGCNPFSFSTKHVSFHPEVRWKKDDKRKWYDWSVVKNKLQIERLCKKQITSDWNTYQFVDDVPLFFCFFSLNYNLTLFKHEESTEPATGGDTLCLVCRVWVCSIVNDLWSEGTECISNVPSNSISCGCEGVPAVCVCVLCS